MATLLERMSRWRAFKVLVVGDFMLDELLYGDADRLSADAPVPVLQVKRMEERPGGAANLCIDLVALKGSVSAFGVVGADDAGRRLRAVLEDAGIDPTGLIQDHTRPTTVKRSHVGLAQHRHPQKMFRVDFESVDPLGAEPTRSMLEAFDAALVGADVVCIEDYGKGVCATPVCRAVIQRARAAGIPVLVDPARVADYEAYRGANAITPNRTEAELATGLETDGAAATAHNGELARRLLTSLDLEAVVLTLDRHGALLLEAGREPVSVPTVARDVYDVTGAGDMVLAGLAAARANGLSWQESVHLANVAAGLEVEQFGVVPVPLERVHHALLLEAGNLHGKLRNMDQVLLEVEACRREGGSIVFTNGCFDVLHSGHVTLVEKAAAFGDFLIVGLNDDGSVRRLKGPDRPVNTADERARVLSALESVGAVVLFGEDTPIGLLEAIRPDVLVKGGDYSHDEVVGSGFVESYGGRIEIVPLVEGRSTSATIERMRG